MDVLWRELAPAAAANNLHQAVHVARRALGADAIDVRDEVLSLAGDVDVDVDLLELAAADARRMRTPAAYRAALSLYRGELLPENRYDDWAEARREELAKLAAELAEESAALGDDRTVRACRRMRARSSAASRELVGARSRCSGTRGC